MTAANQSSSPRIVAVVVLYRTAAKDSATLQTLHAALDAHPEIASAVEVVVWDNTPGERTFSDGFEGRVHHDPTNPGLAAAYTWALHHAVQVCAPWLLTLDQDTHLTADFLLELLRVTSSTHSAAVLPRLTWQGRTLSPFRPRTQGPALPLEDAVHGDTQEYLQAFNSGAALSVEFLKRTGGFDANFPLDYLDHTTFARLHRNGGTVYVMQTALEHELSSQTPGPLTDAALQRERSVLAAERRFVHAYGTQEEQRMYPVRLLRRAASVLLHRRDARLARLIMKTLLGGNR